ncbi:phosphate acyltransferase PlsX [Dethiosulfatarculus sandiegensis]|uniref:phosphate acyltransferase PlsX n=1 Tax=Dethiosulfatarculus sandiegensis TaxID=1429043 RepID=UPI0005CB2F6E|nr:phosphate acyltransferase PlsX [Dethiosulfatarculus sandiegensis]
MRIALDAMGADGGVSVTVSGALSALKDHPGDLEVVLVGKPEAVEPELSRLGAPEEGISIKSASEVVRMTDAPSSVLRHKRDASIRVCFDLHRAGEVDAVVSAGNSGATMAVGMVVMGRAPEVDRPALASIFPGLLSPTVILDVGANVDCTASMLAQFGFMGSVYAREVLGAKSPLVGLLSIGEEGGKGNLVVRQAYEHLKASSLNFAGNVEGRDVFSSEVSVVVCDGFVGNVCLKLSEGLLSAYNQLVKNEVMRDLRGRAGAMLLKPAFKRLANRMDYENFGGAPLLGINGVAYICHGASSPKAIASAIGLAMESVNTQVDKRVSEGLAQYRGELLGEPETKSE